MKLARFQHGDRVYEGVVAGDEVAAVKGSFYETFQENDRRSN